MKNTVKIIGIIALAAVIGFSFAACSSGGAGGGGGNSGSNAGSSEGDNSGDTSPKFPIIYQKGKFLNGVSVTVGNYETFTGKEDGLKKGSVTLRSNHIEITPAEGKNNEYSNDDGNGHYKLEFKFTNNLDLTGYDGIEVELEGSFDGFSRSGFITYFIDVTGKTDLGGGGWKINLLFGRCLIILLGWATTAR